MCHVTMIELCVTGAFVSVVGRRNHEEGTKLVLEVLQQPKLNKQVSVIENQMYIQSMS